MTSCLISFDFARVQLMIFILEMPQSAGIDRPMRKYYWFAFFSKPLLRPLGLFRSRRLCGFFGLSRTRNEIIVERAFVQSADVCHFLNLHDGCPECLEVEISGIGMIPGP